MINNHRIRLCVLALASATLCAFAEIPGEIPAFFSLDTTGCEALIEKNYRQALTALWTQRSIVDSAFWNFKKGVAHFSTNDFANAQACFSYSGRKDSLFRAISYEYIGDIAGLQKKTREAVESYLRAQRDSLHPDYSQTIRSKISMLVNANPLLIDTIPFLNAWRTEAAQTTRETATTRMDALDSLAFIVDRARIDSVLALYTDTVDADQAANLSLRLDSLRVPDSCLLTKRIFRISQIALQAKAPERSLAWLKKASTRPDFLSSIPARTLLYHQAFVEYGCSHYAAAIEFFNRYKSNYGQLPDALFATARSYHRLNQDVQSVSAYELFARLFPRDSRIANVLWFLALESDQKQNYQKAITLYRKIADMKKKPTRAADALFRIGLCQYKAQQYGKACSTFTRINSLYPDAACVLASQYWRSQCYLAREENDKAKNQFLAIIRSAPTDYYAYRAKETLALMGDTASVYAFDTAREYSSARQWLDSLSKDTLSPTDSCSFELGKKLAFSGCSRIARFYLEPLEIRYPGNLRFQFDLGIVYKIINDHISSLRTGRRLMGRIPNKYHDAIPLQVYSLVYPFAFFKDIKQRAATDTVDPFLVLGIIRQESVFNPLAVSHAGAIGLMQLMPSTARTVAAELGVPFVADSLTHCETNIRFGTYYVKKLLDQFRGNIVQAIAAYNGGPPAITRWFEQNKKKTFDLFIEDIGYDETRGYVKKVLANYWTYRILSRMLNIS